jgi:hypothetical protein
MDLRAGVSVRASGGAFRTHTCRALTPRRLSLERPTLEETKRGGGERFGSIDALMTDLNADD